jgi:hypothetical protein
VMYPTANLYQTAEDIYYPLRVVLFIGLLSMGYMLSHPDHGDSVNKELLMDTGAVDSFGPSPWQKQASRKAIERYASSQDRKWRRWNEAMFEKKERKG